MENKVGYPRDYQRALNNVLSERRLEELLKGSTPVFLLGPLMLPRMLKSVTDAEPDFDIAANMTQASLLDYKLWIFEGADLPIVMPSKELGQSVDGVLVFALTSDQRNWLYQFEAESYKELAHVQVEICLRDGNLRNIDAATFVWKGEMDGIVAASSKSWKVDAFLESEWYKNAGRRYHSH
ncbi:predicted protein [Uncinocarpus reesii 1704]|uniref:Gamma-glutamylcyclotransferase AIG2-like domain-containing protein n=1 Tax=Uncinocarpus reesii (strain UAMH 1704) TaxID=336963 RepID=C4JUV0_UNCRE|nr:uncharacterized protein UREG_04903 [Uncinocarpus reesii 1704]EEP80061.1 predicted protein [Uncinocarpus reesii 1704]